jgi:hypothetical protein
LKKCNYKRRPPRGRDDALLLRRRPHACDAMPTLGSSCLVLLLAGAARGASPAPASLELFVDAAAGDGDAAADTFLSVGDAVAAVRGLPRAQRCAPGGVTVTIAGGVYGGEHNRLDLGAADSGCPGTPVVYRAAPHDSIPVLLHGGASVPPSAFKKEGTKTSSGLTVWSADLANLGLAALAETSANFNLGWVCGNGNVRSTSSCRHHLLQADS